MSTICPKDFSACVDDICRGSGVCLATGCEMYSRCNICGAVYSDDVDCSCAPDHGEYDDVEAID